MINIRLLVTVRCATMRGLAN